MSKKMSCFMIIILALVFVFGCGKSDKIKEMEKAAREMEKVGKELSETLKDDKENVADAMKKMGEAFSGGKKVETVDFRELKTLLPENLSGMERKNASGERNSAFGINVSTAKASYMSEDRGRINIEITDMGSMSGLTAMAGFGWAMAEFDRETDTGYEKTTKYSGHKAIEKFDNKSQSGEMNVLVADRFAVEVKGRDVSMKDIKKALDKVDIGKLNKWKEYGVKK